MDIYLIVIIGYVLFRAARFLFKYHNLYKLLGYKRIWLAGNPVIIRKLTPLDFSEEPSGLPLTLFQYKKGVTLFDQMRQSEDDPDRMTNAVIIAKKVAEKSVVYMSGLKIDDLFDSGKVEAIKLGWELYGRILLYNFKTLFRAYQMEKQYVIHVAELCATFGKKPHEHLANKKLNELEKYILDEFVFNAYIENENYKLRQQHG